MFIAITSGNPASTVTAYAKSVKTEWPMYADIDRAFESATLHQVISLQNIHQAMLQTPAGKLHSIGSDDAGMSAAVKKELPNAKWKMDPKEIPPTLKKAWLSLEFGQTVAAIATIKQALGARDAAVKTAAQKLDDVIKADVAARLSGAQAKLAAGQKWDAYKEFEFVVQAYTPYPEAPKARAEMGKLESDPKVRKEKSAKQMLDKVTQMASSRIKSERENAKLGVAMLQRDYADTEAGGQAGNVKLPAQ